MSNTAMSTATVATWVRENVHPTLFAEPSGDACDSYHRYAEDFAIAAQPGFNVRSKNRLVADFD